MVETERLAKRYWEWQEALGSPQREQRLRFRDGDLADFTFELLEIMNSAPEYEDFVIAVVASANDDDDIRFFGGDVVSELIDRGDSDLLERLRRRGLSASAVEAIRSGIY